MSNIGEFIVQSHGQVTCPVVNRRTKDNRRIIIGYIQTQPSYGMEMKVLETRLSPSSEGSNNVDVNYSVHTTSPVVAIEHLDSIYVLKVTTQSGHIYIVEVMGRPNPFRL